MVVLAQATFIHANRGNPHLSLIGAVVHSPLSPEQFRRINGKGWVLMKGQNVSGSIYANLTGRNSVGDARNLFIRGKAHSPNGDYATESIRPDTIKNHNHSYADIYFSEINGSIKLDDGYGNAGPSDFDNRGYEFQRTTGSRGSSETAPKHIILNVFIKIN